MGCLCGQLLFLFFFEAGLPLFLAFADSGHEGVVLFDFLSSDAAPDDQDAVAYGFIDSHDTGGLAVDECEEEFAAVIGGGCE